jgi:molybdenum cofactor synthesis domain-containing protein
MRAAVITVSTSRASGRADDESGDRLAEFAVLVGADVVERDLVGDLREEVEARLRHWADVQRCELILTTGGTGLAPTDVTPEATRAVIERETPGIPHAMREASRQHTPNWMLSRAVAGVRGQSLIINFPGSPRSVAQAGDALIGALPHALALLSGVAPADHAPDRLPGAAPADHAPGAARARR